MRLVEKRANVLDSIPFNVGGGGGGGGAGDGLTAMPDMNVLTVVIGSAALVGLIAGLLLLITRRRTKPRVDDRSALKQFTLPKQVKPVISFKKAAGPGGLKNSPSPLTSPDNADLMTASLRSSHQQPGSGHHTPAVEMSPVDEMNQKMTASANSGCATAGDDATDNPNRGELTCAMRYSFDKNALHVTIQSASGLPPLAGSVEGHLMDPYVKLQLLPEKQHKVKTRVVRNTTSPNYDEEFTFFGIHYNQLQSTTLHFAVVAFDRYSRDEIVGECVCPLHQVDLSDSDRQASITLQLTSRSSKFENADNRGEVLTSLCYQPATNKVTVVVLKAKNLPKFDVTGLADPYVKIYMMYNGQKLSKKKTHVKKRTLTPVYNESFVFDLPSNDPATLDQISFEYQIMDWDRVTKNEIMGRCVVGESAHSAAGKNHWDQVRRNPRRQIAEWHRLRP